MVRHEQLPIDLRNDFDSVSGMRTASRRGSRPTRPRAVVMLALAAGLSAWWQQDGCVADQDGVGLQIKYADWRAALQAARGPDGAGQTGKSPPRTLEAQRLITAARTGGGLLEAKRNGPVLVDGVVRWRRKDPWRGGSWRRSLHLARRDHGRARVTRSLGFANHLERRAPRRTTGPQNADWLVRRDFVILDELRLPAELREDRRASCSSERRRDRAVVATMKHRYRPEEPSSPSPNGPDVASATRGMTTATSATEWAYIIRRDLSREGERAPALVMNLVLTPTPWRCTSSRSVAAGRSTGTPMRVLIAPRQRRLRYLTPQAGDPLY